MDEPSPVVTVEVPAPIENDEEEETEEIQTTADAILEDTKWLKEKLGKLEADLQTLSQLPRVRLGLTQEQLDEARNDLKAEIANLRIELGNLKQSLASPSLPTSSLTPEPIPEVVSPAEEAVVQEERTAPRPPAKRRRI